MAEMLSRAHLEAIRNTRIVQTLLFALGVLLLIAAPIISPLPGPGGLVLAVAGLTLVLRTSLWAKRRYVRFKRWQPKAGSWFDWGLRRGSARRREAIAKDKDRVGAPSPAVSGKGEQMLPHEAAKMVPTNPAAREGSRVTTAARH